MPCYTTANNNAPLCGGHCTQVNNISFICDALQTVP